MSKTGGQKVGLMFWCTFLLKIWWSHFNLRKMKLTDTLNQCLCCLFTWSTNVINSSCFYVEKQTKQSKAAKPGDVLHVWHFQAVELHCIRFLGGSLWVTELGLLLGVEALEAAGDALAVLARLLVKLWHLLCQLSQGWGHSRWGQHGGCEVQLMHQFLAALQTIGSKRESKQQALYWSTNDEN